MFNGPSHRRATSGGWGQWATLCAYFTPSMVPFQMFTGLDDLPRFPTFICLENMNLILPAKAISDLNCITFCSDGWEMLEGASGKGGAEEATGWNRKGFSNWQRWDANEASFTRRAALYSLKCVSTDVDFVTPLCSQVVYEGLVDDIFRIKCGEYE